MADFKLLIRGLHLIEKPTIGLTGNHQFTQSDYPSFLRI